MFPVSPEKQQQLAERMARLGLRAEDLQEDFVRSGGKGGQNVNKVATCVVLRHVPSGTTVKCQEARTQAMNRFLARRRLCDVVEAAREGRASAQQQAIERIRRQKRKRSKRAKEKMVEAKVARGAVKALRRPPRVEEG
jgi:protein subunit release factor B